MATKLKSFGCDRCGKSMEYVGSHIITWDNDMSKVCTSCITELASHAMDVQIVVVQHKNHWEFQCPNPLMGW